MEDETQNNSDVSNGEGLERATGLTVAESQARFEEAQATLNAARQDLADAEEVERQRIREEARAKGLTLPAEYSDRVRDSGVTQSGNVTDEQRVKESDMQREAQLRKNLAPEVVVSLDGTKVRDVQKIIDAANIGLSGESLASVNASDKTNSSE
jgi:hypothetical protein